jgi:hypothetical protein
MTSTNYFNTLIEIAEDCPVANGEIPPVRGTKKSVANLQFEMLHQHPYEFSSDDVLFSVFATRKGIPDEELAEQRAIFFSKGQPCFRASPLTKRYGWGIHSNEAGKIAMVDVESEVYQNLAADESIIKTKAMRSKRA